MNWSPFDDYKVKPTAEQIELFDIHMNFIRAKNDAELIEYTVNRFSDFPDIMEEFAQISKEHKKTAYDRFVLELGQFLKIDVHPEQVNHDDVFKLTMRFNRAINEAQNLMTEVLKRCCYHDLIDLPRKMIDDTYKQTLKDLKAILCK
jgi:hypothetical protein